MHSPHYSRPEPHSAQPQQDNALTKVVAKETKDADSSLLTTEIKTVLSGVCDYSKPNFWLDKDTSIADKEQRIQLLEQQIQNLKNDILSLADALEKDEKHGEWEDLVF